LIAAGDGLCSTDVVEDLACLDQERRSRYSQADVVSAALQEAHTELALKPLKLLAQGRLHDVLPLSCPTEMQFLGQSHEVAKLTKFHARQAR
jgi:hypothetical protein